MRDGRDRGYLSSRAGATGAGGIVVDATYVSWSVLHGGTVTRMAKRVGP
ncbi:MAG TPA: hypothetical protein VIY73_25015 [Polyangiaceae bacterium]